MNEPRSTIDRPTRQRRWFRSLYVRAAILSVVIGLALFVLIWWPRRSTWAVLMAGGHIGRMDEWKHFEAGMSNNPLYYHGDTAQSVLQEFSAAEERFAKLFMTRQLRRK